MQDPNIKIRAHILEKFLANIITTSRVERQIFEHIVVAHYCVSNREGNNLASIIVLAKVI